jgi:hypothetical protein
MAKKNQKRLKDFFEGRRRQCELQDFHVLKNTAGEKRMKLSIRMPLSQMPMEGIPDAFVDQYILMEREKSALNFAKIFVILDGASFTIFSTDVSSASVLNVNAATLQDFRLIGEGSEEKRRVFLEFIAYLPATVKLKDWSFDHLHSDFFCEVVPAQTELNLEEQPPAKKGKKKQQELVIQ